MTTIAGFSPETARFIYETVRYLRESGFVILPPSGTDQKPPPPTPIFVRNDSGGTIPAWACMQSTGTVEHANQNFITVGKPDGSGKSYLFNGQHEIAAGEYGVAQDSPVVRGYKGSGTVTEGDRWAPTSGQWYLTKSPGPFVAVGLDDIDTDVFRMSVDYSSRLYRFTLNASLASGTADADILEMDGTDTGLDEDVLDPLGIFASLTTVGDAGLCIFQDGKYYVIQAPCP